MDPKYKPLLIVAGIVGFYIYLQLLCLLISVWSGWRALAVRFRSDQLPTGRRWKMQSARLRAGAHYNNALNLAVDDLGLFLSTIWILPQHPAMNIPWSEIRVTGQQKILFWDYTILSLGTQEQIPFTIRTELWQQLRNEAGVPL